MEGQKLRPGQYCPRTDTLPARSRLREDYFAMQRHRYIAEDLQVLPRLPGKNAPVPAASAPERSCQHIGPGDRETAQNAPAEDVAPCSRAGRSFPGWQPGT